MAILCILSTITHIAQAGRDTDFYRVSIPVESQTAQERQRAAESGLKKVMLRVSGSPSVWDAEALQSTYEAAISYVEEFQYETQQSSRLGMEERQDVITLKFSPRVIERLLRESGQRFWPVNRPRTLIWLVEDDFDFGKQYLGPDMGGETIRAIKQAARDRGLPVVFPYLDLDDHIALPVLRAWRFDEVAILEASKRYKADGVLVGRYTQTSRGDVRTSWMYLHAGEIQYFDVNIASDAIDPLAQFGSQVIYPVANWLAEKYAILPQEIQREGVVMELVGVDSFGQYRAALDYLERFAAIKNVSITEIKNNRLLLGLDTDMGVARLEASFELDRSLKKVATGGSQNLPVWQQAELGSYENPLRYQWNK